MNEELVQQIIEYQIINEDIKKKLFKLINMQVFSKLSKRLVGYNCHDPDQTPMKL